MANAALLLIVGEPLTPSHKDLILAEITKGFRGWDEAASGVDINTELVRISDRASAGQDGPEAYGKSKGGERIIHHTAPSILVEILINPQTQTIKKSLKNFLLISVAYRHLIYAGHSFQGSGAWLLQDDTFHLSRFAQVFKDPEVEAILKQKESTLNIHCISEGDWKNDPAEKLGVNKLVKLCINPDEKLSDVNGAVRFSSYIASFLECKTVTSLLPASDIVGNIRFNKPTIYIFPGCEGDSSLFGISGFNLLVNGGYNRRACFWDFTCHLDRIDAILLTHLGTDNIFGIGSALERKSLENVYPEIGHIFLNSCNKVKHSSEDGDTATLPGKKTDLLVNLSEEGNSILEYSKQLGYIPNSCTRPNLSATIEPVNLYHKVGHGSLDMYILTPVKDTKEMKSFFENWNKLSCNFGSQNGIANENLMSVSTLIVWKPDNPTENITRILFPGNSPQNKIFEGLEKLKGLEYLKHPTCCTRLLSTQKPVSTAPTRPSTIKTTTEKSKTTSSSTRTVRKTPVPLNRPAVTESRKTVPERRKIPAEIKPVSSERKKSPEGKVSSARTTTPITRKLKSPEKPTPTKDKPATEARKAKPTAEACKEKVVKDKTPSPKKVTKPKEDKSPEPLPSPKTEAPAAKHVVENGIKESKEVKPTSPHEIITCEKEMEMKEHVSESAAEVNDNFADTVVCDDKEITSVVLSEADIPPQGLPEPIAIPPGYCDHIDDIGKCDVTQAINGVIVAENVDEVNGAMEQMTNDEHGVLPNREEYAEVHSQHEHVPEVNDLIQPEPVCEENDAHINNHQDITQTDNDNVACNGMKSFPVDFEEEECVHDEQPIDASSEIRALEKDDREEYENDYSSQGFMERDSSPMIEHCEEEPQAKFDGEIHIGDRDIKPETMCEIDDAVKEHESESVQDKTQIDHEIGFDQDEGKFTDHLIEVDQEDQYQPNHSDEMAEHHHELDFDVHKNLEQYGIHDNLKREESPDLLGDYSAHDDHEHHEVQQQESQDKYTAPIAEPLSELMYLDEPMKTTALLENFEAEREDHEFCDEDVDEEKLQETETQVIHGVSHEAETVFDDDVHTESCERAVEYEDIQRDSLERETDMESGVIDVCDQSSEFERNDAYVSNEHNNCGLVYDESVPHEQPSNSEHETHFGICDDHLSNEEHELYDEICDEHPSHEEHESHHGICDEHPSHEEHELHHGICDEHPSHEEHEAHHGICDEHPYHEEYESHHGICDEHPSHEEHESHHGICDEHPSHDEHVPHHGICDEHPSHDEHESHHGICDEHPSHEEHESHHGICDEHPSHEEHESHHVICHEALIHSDIPVGYAQNVPEVCLEEEETGSSLPAAFEKDITPDPMAPMDSDRYEFSEVKHHGENSICEEKMHDGILLDDDFGRDDQHYNHGESCEEVAENECESHGDAHLCLQPGLDGVNPFYAVDQHALEQDMGTHQRVVDGELENDDQSFNPIKEWGEPMALPQPQPMNTASPAGGDASRHHTTSEAKRAVRSSTFERLATSKSRPASARTERITTTKTTTTRRPMSSTVRSSTTASVKNGVASLSPVYVDLSYIPAHGDPAYSDIEFFKNVRARYYVLSTLTPNPQTLSALLDAKKTWGNKDLEVSVIPTYESENLRHWMALNADQLNEFKIDVVPAASRCTIQLQDHDTNCLAYRLEF